MIFLAPAVLIGLVALPALYFLMRLTPPAPRKIAFPPLALLRGLPAEERTPENMPLWPGRPLITSTRGFARQRSSIAGHR
jgi:hypothetical protein